MTNRKGKNIVIDVSSSSSSDDNGDEIDISSDSASSGNGCDSIDDDEDVYEVDDDDDEEDDFSDDDCRGAEDDDDDSLANRVIRFLQGKRDLQELSLIACKAYLRRHGLRVSGKKNECILRVQEHWRLKDGKAEQLYPMSSFTINCTGDVCKGDTVRFKQKVYGRKGKLPGKRTVVGQVVKESYGAAKQQHTFTVEVLWSKGIKKLPTLFPLLIKGRNLYRMKTFRQLWKNEGERKKVLAEKHRRGTVARCNRAKRINVLSTDKGRKSQKVSRSRISSRMNFSGVKCYGTEEGASCVTTNWNNKQNNVKQGASRNITRSQFSKPFPRRRHDILGLQGDRISTLPSSQFAPRKYLNSQMGPHCSTPFDSQSTNIQGELLYHGPVMMPADQRCDFNQNSYHNFDDIQSPWMTHMDSRQFLPSRSVHGQWMNGPIKCSFQGCCEPGSHRCVVAACWRCCQRVRMVCYVHR